MYAYPFQHSWPCRHHGARQLREHQWKHQRGQQHGSDLSKGTDRIKVLCVKQIERVARTLFGVEIDFNGGVATGVEDLTSDND